MDQQRNFRFLDLSPELRNRIYECVFTENKDFIPETNPTDFRYKPPGILLGCKQIYTEAILMHYHLTQFYVAYRPGLAWFGKIAEPFQQEIQCIRMCGFRVDADDVESALEWCWESATNAGAKLAKGTIYMAVYSHDRRGMVWTNEVGGAESETLAEVDHAYSLWRTRK